MTHDTKCETLQNSDGFFEIEQFGKFYVDGCVWLNDIRMCLFRENCVIKYLDSVNPVDILEMQHLLIVNRWALFS